MPTLGHLEEMCSNTLSVAEASLSPLVFQVNMWTDGRRALSCLGLFDRVPPLPCRRQEEEEEEEEEEFT